MTRNRRERGATLVEFSFVLLTFLMFLLSILDISRLLWTWNAAAEVTRAGARYAAVCDDVGRDAEVLQKMRRMLPEIGAITLQWEPAGCDKESCEGVTVRITELEFEWMSPLIGTLQPTFDVPTFQTYLPREIMRRDPKSEMICS